MTVCFGFCGINEHYKAIRSVQIYKSLQKNLPFAAQNRVQKESGRIAPAAL
jgi:hypothetical protein